MNFRYKSENDQLPVPYGPKISPEHNNAGFIDTKLFPERIGEIREADNAPELRMLIHDLSARDSFFRTLNCDIASNPCDCRGFRWKVSSWLDICFEIVAFNMSQKPYDDLASDFRTLHGASIPKEDGICIDFAVNPTAYNEAGFWGKRLTIWSAGFGDDSDGAWANWRTGHSRVSDFLKGLSSNNSSLLDRHLTFLGINEETQTGWTAADNEILADLKSD